MAVYGTKKRGMPAFEHGNLIGLTGLYCAGKNYAARVFERHGIPVFDVDKAGHEVIAVKKQEIAACFGGDILGEDGAVDRKKLGAKVFGKPEELRALEAIVHPATNRLVNEWIRVREGATAVINAALLHKCDCFDRLDGIIIIHAPLPVRLWRAKKRDRLPLFQLIKRFAAQKTFSAQYFQKNADIKTIVIENFGSGMERKLMDVGLF
jgi:dephospho-CoA kinase